MAKRKNMGRLIFPQEDNDIENLNSFHANLSKNLLILRRRNWEREVAIISILSLSGDTSYRELWSRQYGDPDGRLPVVPDGKYIVAGFYDAYLLETGGVVLCQDDFCNFELNFSGGDQFVFDDVYYVRIDGQKPEKGSLAIDLKTKKLRYLDFSVSRPRNNAKTIGLALHFKEGVAQDIRSITGDILWSYDAGDLLKSVDRNRQYYRWPYAVHNDRLYLLCSEHVVVIDIKTGKELARFHYFEMPEFRNRRSSVGDFIDPPRPYPERAAQGLVVSDQVIALYYLSTYSFVVGIDPLDGKYLWTIGPEHSPAAVPVVYNDMLYTAGETMTHAGCHLGFDARTGIEIWRGEMRSGANQICVSEDYVVFWCNLGDIIAYSRHVPSPPPKPRALRK